MKPLDRLLQRWRIAKALRYVPRDARVLDVGCADGALFRQARDRIREGVGIDPTLEAPRHFDRVTLLPGVFPNGAITGSPFDVITMLAVLEHVPESRQAELASACARHLRPGGRLIISVPSPMVDRILDLLRLLRVIDGMCLEEHHGFHPAQTPRIFEGHLELVRVRRFQLGLNHLFVFEKPS